MNKEKLKIHENLISVEGIDGAGKSTFIKSFKEYFKSEKVEILRYDTAPFDEDATTYIRAMLSSTEKEIDTDTKNKSLLYAFISDFIIHENNISKFVSETLFSNAGMVVSDRYLLSTIAYQSLNIPFEEVCDIIKKSNLKFPKYIIYLDCNPEIAIKRISARNEEKEIFEKLDTLKQVYENYKKGLEWISRNSDAKIIRLDASIDLSNYPDYVKRIAEIIDEKNLYN